LSSVLILLILAPFISLAAEPATSGVQTNQAVIHWQHPAGLVTAKTLEEIRAKLKDQAWARRVFESTRASLEPWLAVSSDKLRAVFPKKRGNVYHDFSCPTDRCRLTFDPFSSESFVCPTCGKHFAPDLDPGVYPKGNRYNGVLYDGWACLYYETACQVAADLGTVAAIEPESSAKYAPRGVEILMLYADTIEKLKTKFDPDPQMNVLLTYHREGDSVVLFDLARAYELLRAHMTVEQRTRFEHVVLERMLNDIMLEPRYRTESNNNYQWHRTIVQTALALERADLIDWSFGFGKAAPERLPEHRSIRRLLATHFRADGAFRELCSGYHLYPVHALCEFAVVSRGLAQMDPVRFPPNRYDLTSAENPQGRVIQNALTWFIDMAMPDRTMPTVGDSMAPRAGMDDYYACAEVGYRFFGLKAVGDYEKFRNGSRSWAALLYGAPEIRKHATPFSSSYLSSGWVSLRNEWQSNRVWIGLNALDAGGGHQHADRLNLVSYSQGQLLALEKATPYNENVTHDLARLSPMHNTVTVDQISQKPGASLHGAELPKVTFFFTGPIAQVAQLNADHLYPQTQEYRRTVALIEDIYVDQFTVRGGKVLDWMFHHAGTTPELSVPLKEETFTPASWLAHGVPTARVGRTDNTWESRWRINDVTSRLTMFGAPGTEVWSLQTYPVDQAVITKDHPACQSLCVLRHGDTWFVAVGDAWRDTPNLLGVGQGDSTNSVRLKTRTNTYYLLLGAKHARFDDGVTLTTDAAALIVRNRDAFVLCSGTSAQIDTPQGSLKIALQPGGSVAAEIAQGTVTYETGEDVQYETVGGENYNRQKNPRAVQFDGNLWQISKREQRVTGQRKDPK
jgi:hypothetical protein